MISSGVRYFDFNWPDLLRGQGALFSSPTHQKLVINEKLQYAVFLSKMHDIEHRARHMPM